MIRFIAIVQEGCVSDALRAGLTDDLQAIASETFAAPPETAPVFWREIPRGYGWTAGEPSRTSAVLCAVPEDTPSATRLRFLTRLNAAWVDRSGADPNELLLFTFTPPDGAD